MAITNEDIRNLRRWGRDAALDPERGSALLAGEYMALATSEEERIVIRSEFEEGARNSGVNQSRVDDAMWSFKDWAEFWMFRVYN